MGEAKRRRDLEKIATEEAKEEIKKTKTSHPVRAALVGGMLVGTALFGAFYTSIRSLFTEQTPIAYVEDTKSPSLTSQENNGNKNLDDLIARFKEEFKDIPGTKEFYPVEGAKYTLVHIRQMPYNTSFNTLKIEDKIQLYHDLLTYHKEIRETLRALAKIGYKDVYLKDFSEDDVTKIGNSTLESIESSTNKLINTYYQQKKDKENLQFELLKLKDNGEEIPIELSNRLVNYDAILSFFDGVLNAKLNAMTASIFNGEEYNLNFIITSSSNIVLLSNKDRQSIPDYHVISINLN